MQRGKGSLRIKVDAQHTVAAQGETLGKVGRGRCLARAALEVHHADDLQVVTVTPPWDVVAGFASSLFQEHTQVLNILSGIVSAVACGQLGRGALAIEVKFAKIGIVHTKKCGCLT